MATRMEGKAMHINMSYRPPLQTASVESLVAQLSFGRHGAFETYQLPLFDISLICPSCPKRNRQGTARESVLDSKEK